MKREEREEEEKEEVKVVKEEEKMEGNISASITTLFHHQISGHGALIKLSGGKIGKPLIPRESWFYRSLTDASALQPFTAKYFGSIDLKFSSDQLQTWKNQLDALQADYFHKKEAPDHDTKENSSRINPWSLKVTKTSLNKMLSKEALIYPYLVLEDLTVSYRKPCICDVKIGTRQHGDDAAPDKKLRHAAKCETTTSKPLGIRLCGHMVYDPDEKKFLYFDKYEGRKVTVDNIHQYFSKFLQNGSTFRSDILLEYIGMLERLVKVVEQLTDTYRFYSTSLLFVYEGSPSENEGPKCDMRMIDFAHTFPFEEGDPKDDGYLFGLKNLLKLMEHIAKK